MCSYAVEPGGENVQMRLKPLQYTENYLPVMPLSQVACMHDASNHDLNLMPSCTHLLIVSKIDMTRAVDMTSNSAVAEGPRCRISQFGQKC